MSHADFREENANGQAKNEDSVALAGLHQQLQQQHSVTSSGSLLQRRSLSYSNVAGAINALPTFSWSWRREMEGGGALFLMGRASGVLNAQLVMAAKLPALVCASEASSTLPSPGHSTS